jgi:hypothetical protein
MMWRERMSSTAASRMSSSVTVTISSTRLTTCAKFSGPSDWVRTPSAMVWPTSSAGHWTRLPVVSVSRASPASSGSTPMIRTDGLTALTAAAMPLMSPPPPTGTTTDDRPGSCRSNSRPMVPWPAITSASLYGGSSAWPVCAAMASARRRRPSLPPPQGTSAPPSSAIAPVFGPGASAETTMVALTPRSLATCATAMPWLPLE